MHGILRVKVGGVTEKTEDKCIFHCSEGFSLSLLDNYNVTSGGFRGG